MQPSHPLFERFEKELVVGDQTFEWTFHERDFFFRPSESDIGILWCELARHQAVTRFDLEKSQRTQKRIAKNLQKQRIWRFWPLENERELVLNLDFALIRQVNAPFWLRLDWLKPFFRDGDDLLFRTGADFFPIEHFLENGDVDWELAAACFDETSSVWNWFDCERGSMETLQKLAEAYILLSDGYIKYYGAGHLRFSSILQASQQSPASVWHSTYRIAEILDSHFSLRFKSFVPRIYEASGALKKHPSLFINRKSEPTNHEKLEALLLWRDFLRGKMPEAEIETLLPKI